MGRRVSDKGCDLVARNPATSLDAARRELLPSPADIVVGTRHTSK